MKRRYLARWCAVALSLMALAAACISLAGCSPKVQIDDASPKVADVKLSADSQMNESSQAVSIVVTFDRQISADGDIAGDFKLLLNGKEPDAATIKVDARASANAVTFTLSPSDSASKGAGAGQYFALYQAQFSLSAAREDGALAHIGGATGSTAVLPEAITGTLPSGLAIDVTAQKTGAADEAAQVTFTVTSPAKARVITWFSPDGGQTVLLKHNHAFAQASAEDAAADLAKVINAANIHLMATARGAEVTVTATEAVEGQVINPIVMEGVGVAGGEYDASQGMGA